MTEAISRRKKRLRENDETYFTPNEHKFRKKRKIGHEGKIINVDEVDEQLSTIKSTWRAVLGLVSKDVALDSSAEKIMNWVNTALETRQKSARDLRAFPKQLQIIFGVISECFLALRIIKSILIQPIYRNGMTAVRVCLELYDRLSLQSNAMVTDDSLTYLTSGLNLLSDVRVKQVRIDEFLFRLASLPNSFQWPSVLPQLAKSLSTKSEKSRKRKRHEWYETTEKCLIPGYNAMIAYVNWVLMKKEFPENGSTSGTVSEDQIRTTLIKHTEDALLAFEEFHLNSKDSVGCWDIFIPKHIELLEYKNTIMPDATGCLEQAGKILKHYANQNVDNPNAWRFLYEFKSRHSADVKERIGVLQELCSNVPSDVLVVELCGLISDTNETSKTGNSNIISLLFNHLDYNLSDSSAWCMLAEVLMAQASQTKTSRKCITFDDVVKECWMDQNRNSWWPSYQFSTKQKFVDLSSEESQTLSFKAVIAHLLLGSQNEFTLTVEDALHSNPDTHNGMLLLRKARQLPSFSWL